MSGHEIFAVLFILLSVVEAYSRGAESKACESCGHPIVYGYNVNKGQVMCEGCYRRDLPVE